MTNIGYMPSPVGRLLLAEEDGFLTGLWLDGQKHYAAGLGEAEENTSPALQAAMGWLDAYFAGENPPVHLPLRPKGSAFSQAVWQLLLHKEVHSFKVLTP